MIEFAPPPSICVLLATYNGEPWLAEQLQSIIDQKGVRPMIVASDDGSTDTTLAILQEWAQHCALTVMPASPVRFRSAHRNFLCLIRDAPLGDACYVALADQDDIWLPDKLARAVQCLGSVPADAYSSDVTAFWPDGRRSIVHKSHPQRSHDYLFGSPGPGCTFVMPRPVFERLRAWVTAGYAQMQDIWVHDWLMYAYIRGHSMRWHIDDQPNMLYRQHDRNEVGANRGMKAALARWHQVRTGTYRRDILAIADVIGDRSKVVTALRRLSPIDRLWLVAHVRSLRRRLSEAFILAALILFMPRETRS